MAQMNEKEFIEINIAVNEREIRLITGTITPCEVASQSGRSKVHKWNKTNIWDYASQKEVLSQLQNLLDLKTKWSV